MGQCGDHGQNPSLLNVKIQAWAMGLAACCPRDEGFSLVQLTVAATKNLETPHTMKPDSSRNVSAGDANTSGVHEQQRGKKRKKGQDPRWLAMIAAIQAKDSEAAWKNYGEGNETRNFQPGILKAMATLFLGTVSEVCLRN